MRELWHESHVEQVRQQYPHMQTKAIAAMVERRIGAVYQLAQRLGLRKTDTYLESPLAGRTNGRQGAGTRFQPGLVPWNKGTHYVAGGRSAETRFKPGVRRGVAVRLYKPIGTLRVTKDGYLSRKVNDGMPLQSRWRLEHLVVWEAANGPLPKGYAVCFKNGDRKDVRLDNLHLMSRSDLMKRNSVHNLPKPLAEVAQLRGALIRQINRRARREQD